MIFQGTPIPDVHVVDIDPRADERGFFARAFCREEFTIAGLEAHIEQANLSFNHRAGTVRGMHLQVAPHPETKFIRCTRGAILDTVVDLRPDSATYLDSVSVELTADNRRGLFVPAFFAHGYQTLQDDTEVLYLVSGAYAPGFERGVRYDDPELEVEWPLPVTDISDKDRSWPLLSTWTDGDRRGVTGGTT